MEITVTIPARFAESGWQVRLLGSNQPYYVFDDIEVMLPQEHARRQGRLHQPDGGKVLVGYYNVPQFIVTVGPNDLVVVQLPLEDAQKLIERMKEDA